MFDGFCGVLTTIPLLAKLLTNFPSDILILDLQLDISWSNSASFFFLLSAISNFIIDNKNIWRSNHLPVCLDGGAEAGGGYNGYNRLLFSS